MCNCVAEKEEDVRYLNGAEEARIEVRGQWSPGWFRRITQKGVLAERRSWTTVDWDFCPFCGKAIE